MLPARHFLTLHVAALIYFNVGSPSLLRAQEESEGLPNVVIIFIDDMGYADIGPFGAEAYATPNLDRMAEQGRVFTDFHTSAPVCSAARAALLTGCYHERVSIRGALGSLSKIGLHPDEVTLAEICKQRGYATAVFGKWHLGRPKKFLPLQQGFDEYFGLPYSNDMWPHADLPHLPVSDWKQKQPPLPMIEDNEVFDEEITWEEQNDLTTWYTERAVDFIDRNHEQPFFLYVPHTMVHVPLGVSEKFRGKSDIGLFGDVVMELDWSVGEILAALDRHQIADNTLVVFTADNGPWLNYGNHAGSAAPLREGKGTCWEGGHRVPCVMRWPARIPANTKCDELSATIDMLPTVAKLIDVPLPEDRIIDGKDIYPLMTGEADVQSPHEAFYCYYQGNLCNVRDRRWVLSLPHRYRTLDGRTGGQDGRACGLFAQTNHLGTLRPAQRHQPNHQRRKRVPRRRRTPAKTRRNRT